MYIVQYTKLTSENLYITNEEDGVQIRIPWRTAKLIMKL